MLLYYTEFSNNQIVIPKFPLLSIFTPHHTEGDMLLQFVMQIPNCQFVGHTWINHHVAMVFFFFSNVILLIYNYTSFMAPLSLSHTHLFFVILFLGDLHFIVYFLKATPCYLYFHFIHWNNSYLWEEWKQRQKDTSEDVSSQFLNLRFVPLEVFA